MSSELSARSSEGETTSSEGGARGSQVETTSSELSARSGEGETTSGELSARSGEVETTSSELNAASRGSRNHGQRTQREKRRRRNHERRTQCEKQPSRSHEQRRQCEKQRRRNHERRSRSEKRRKRECKIRSADPAAASTDGAVPSHLPIPPKKPIVTSGSPRQWHKKCFIVRNQALPQGGKEQKKIAKVLVTSWEQFAKSAKSTPRPSESTEKLRIFHLPRPSSPQRRRTSRCSTPPADTLCGPACARDGNLRPPA